MGGHYVVELTRQARERARQVDHCLIPVSVGNKNQAGRALHAAVLWATRNFSSVRVDLGDTLARHDMPDGDACQAARHLGDLWLERNQSFLEGLPVTRWDAYLDHEAFPAAHANTQERYCSDPVFRSAVQQDVSRFAARSGRDRCAESYILEEYTVDSTFITHPTAFLYPGRPLNCYADLKHLHHIQYRLRHDAKHPMALVTRAE